MNKLILAGAAALALAVPAVAQDLAVTADGDVYVLSPEQDVIYKAWPAERRVDYDAWPNDYRVYFWTLTEPQQEGWWVLTPDQRTRIIAMTPEARVAAWTAVEQQMAGIPSANASATAQVATTAAGSASAMEPRWVSNAVVQTTPADTNAATAGGDLPVCKPNQQDGCINSWEKNRTGNRPLNHWPGQPASEMAGKKPQM